MSELWVYDTAPRGLASNNGFEEEDAARAVRLGQNALNAQYHRAMDEMQKLFSMLWRQDKHVGVMSEADFLKWAIEDADLIVRERAAAGVLPTDGVNP